MQTRFAIDRFRSNDKKTGPRDAGQFLGHLIFRYVHGDGLITRILAGEQSVPVCRCCLADSPIGLIQRLLQGFNCPAAADFDPNGRFAHGRVAKAAQNAPMAVCRRHLSGRTAETP